MISTARCGAQNGSLQLMENCWSIRFFIGFLNVLFIGYSNRSRDVMNSLIGFICAIKQTSLRINVAKVMLKENNNYLTIKQTNKFLKAIIRANIDLTYIRIQVVTVFQWGRNIQPTLYKYINQLCFREIGIYLPIPSS